MYDKITQKAIDEEKERLNNLFMPIESLIIENQLENRIKFRESDNEPDKHFGYVLEGHPLDFKIHLEYFINSLKYQLPKEYKIKIDVIDDRTAILVIDKIA